jgi:hypothetical protein
MNEKKTFGRVPQSITFGYKVLHISTLAEMGIPLSGLGLVKPNEGLSKYTPDPNACWIERGDPLLTYEFWYFQNEKEPRFSFSKDPIWERTYEIVSPISGLLLSMREEQTAGLTGGLLYQWDNEKALPVILVPNDEPPPDSANFNVYDEMARVLYNSFNLLPIRDYSKPSPERLRGWLDRNEGDATKVYLERLTALQERNPNDHRAYDIREISAADGEVIRSVQHLRANDLDLREKLVHIARKYGESI